MQVPDSVFNDYADCSSEIARLARVVADANVLPLMKLIHGKSSWKYGLSYAKGTSTYKSTMKVLNALQELADCCACTERVTLWRNCNAEDLDFPTHLGLSATVSKTYADERKEDLQVQFVCHTGVKLIPTLGALVGQRGAVAEMEVLLPELTEDTVHVKNGIYHVYASKEHKNAALTAKVKK